jgi:hypothetical protein
MGRQLSPYEQIRRKVLFEHLDKYPNTSSHSIARILVRDYPDYFNNHEHARSMIRIYKGSNGKYCRKILRNTKYYKPENIKKDE